MDRRKTIAGSDGVKSRRVLTPPSTFLKNSISGQRSVSSSAEKASGLSRVKVLSENRLTGSVMEGRSGLRPSANIVRGSTVGQRTTNRSVSYALNKQSLPPGSKEKNETTSIPRSKSVTFSGRRSLAGVGSRNNEASNGAKHSRAVVSPLQASEIVERKEEVDEEKQKLQRIIVKLQEKLHTMSTEIEQLQGQVLGLEKQNVSLKEAAEANEDNFEMLTIDKEYLDEQNQLLNSKLETLNNEYNQLKHQFEDLQAQFSHSSKSESNINENVFERNEKLELALVRLRQVSEERETELVNKIDTLKSDIKMAKDYKEKYELVSHELEDAHNLIAELKAQMEFLAESAELIETLTEKNFNLNEENIKLKDTVVELEDLRDLANDLEEAHNESEKELKRDIERLKKIVENDQLEIEAFKRKTKQFENLINNQKQKYNEEISNSRAELSGLLQNSTQYDVNAELLQNKINDLNFKINKLESIAFKSDLRARILQQDVANESQMKETFESFLKEFILTTRGTHDPQYQQLINCGELIKCTNIIPSLIELAQIISTILLDENKLLGCSYVMAAKDFLGLKSVFSILLAKFKYGDDINDFKNVYDSLNNVYSHMKNLSMQLSDMELNESLNDSLSYIVGAIKLSDGQSKMTKVDSSDLFTEILQWPYFNFKNIEVFGYQLVILSGILKISLNFLQAIAEYTDSDVSVTLEKSSLHITSGLTELSKRFRTLLVVVEKQLQIVDGHRKSKVEMLNVLDKTIFLTDLNELNTILSKICDIKQKIEHESYSFTSELEKDFTTVFDSLINEDNVLATYISKVDDIIGKLTLTSYETKDLSDSPTSYHKILSTYLENSTQTHLNIEEINAFKTKLSDMSISLDEKDRLISELSLKINLLKGKLDIQNEKDGQIASLEKDVNNYVEENSRQKKVIKELLATTEKQGMELKKKLRNKDLIGDFDTIFEEKEFCSKLTLMSEIQSMRYLVHYLMVQQQSRKNTKAIFGIPTDYSWLHNATRGSSNLLPHHQKLQSLTNDYLFKLASVTKLNPITRPKSDKDLFSWKPKKAALDYYNSTMDNEIHQYKGLKQALITSFKMESHYK